MNKLLYPNKKIDRIEDITPKFMQENNLKGLIMDIDNTLVMWKSEPEKRILKWIDMMRKNDIKLCLLSNNNKDRVQYIGEKLGLPVLYSAKKPMKSGFIKAIKFLKLKNENIAMAGDQLFTDVLGGNRNNLYTIFVKPRSNQEHLITRVKRPIEKYFLKKYDKMEVLKREQNKRGTRDINKN